VPQVGQIELTAPSSRHMHPQAADRQQPTTLSGDAGSACSPVAHNMRPGARHVPRARMLCRLSLSLQRQLWAPVWRAYHELPLMPNNSSSRRPLPLMCSWWKEGWPCFAAAELLLSLPATALPHRSYLYDALLAGRAVGAWLVVNPRVLVA
jgi:hypothetical protein